MTELNDDELGKIVAAAKKARGGKPAKYPSLDKYGESIERLIDNDVQLPFILKWLLEEKGEKLVLNTLRKFVIKKIGRDRYEQYLARNGWQKSKRSKPGSKPAGAAEKSDSGRTSNGLGFELDIPKPREFKRTERK